MNRTALVAVLIVATLITVPTLSCALVSEGSGLSYTQTTDADPAVPETTTVPTGPSKRETSNSGGILLILLLLGVATLFYFLKIQRPSLPDFSGITGRDPSIDNPKNRPISATKQKLPIDSVTATDKRIFQQLLIDVHRAWSKQDLAELRQLVTQDMLNDFSAALADNTSHDIRNHVEDVVLLRAEVLEVWTEHGTLYVTAGLRWSARNYNVSLTKQPGEPGYVVEGSEKTPTE